MSKDMRGTMFAFERKGATDPTHIGCVQIDGVRVDLAVYPEEIGKKGNPYQPIKLHYPNGSAKILKGANQK